MSLFVADTPTLFAVAPDNVTAYLRSRGWSPVGSVRNDVARFHLAFEGETAEIDVPLRQTFRDYALRIRDLLETLTVVEARSPHDVYQDLLRTNQDVIRISVEVPESGRLRLDEAGTLISAAQDLLLAAACAVHSQRVYYPSRKPQRAIDYLRTVNLAAPEAGSFVVVLESPLPASFATSPSSAVADDEPFERTTLLTLARAAGRARAAIATANVKGTLESFSDEIRHGVNANYCDALATMLEDVASRDLKIALSWASSLPLRQEVPARFVFSKRDGEVLRAAARFLKERAPVPDFELIGLVVRLETPDPTFGGNIAIAGLVDGAIRQVQLSLDPEEYQQAIEAHQHQRGVSVEGELVKDGRSFRLHHHRSFSLHAYR